jgi:hypothetical protein
MHNTQRNAAPHTPVSSAAARRVQPHVRVHTVLTDRHDTALPTRVYQLRTAGGTAVMAAAVGVATPRLRAHALRVCRPACNISAQTIHKSATQRAPLAELHGGDGHKPPRIRILENTPANTAGLQRALLHSPTGLGSMHRTRVMYVLEIPRRADAGAAPTNALPRETWPQGTGSQN